MPSRVGVVTGRGALRVGPRSVIAGRQRWDMGVVRGRPGVAELLEAALREAPGVGVVQVNPVTGRLLVYHEAVLSSEEVGQLVRRAVALAVRQPIAPTRTRPGPARPEPSVTVGARPGRRAVASVAVAASAVGALVVGRALRRSPLVRFGAVVAATVAIAWRTWRRSRPAAPTQAGRHPLLRIVGPYRRRFYAASLLSVLVQFLDTAMFLVFGSILLVLASGKRPALVRLGLTSASSQLWFLTGAAAVGALASAALSFIVSVLWRGLAQSVQQEWRAKTYAHVQRVELRYLEGERMTRVAGVLTGDVDQLGRFFASSAHDLLQLGAGSVLLVPVFLIFAPSIAWIAFLPVPAIAWLSFSHQEHATPGYAASSQSGSLLNSQLVNNLEASTTVKSFVAEAYEIDRITRLTQAHRQDNRQIDTRTAAYTQTVRVYAAASVMGVLLFGGLEVLRGALRFDVFNALIGMPNLILLKLPGLGDAVDQYQRTVAALGRVLDLYRLPVEADTNGAGLDVAKVNGEMTLEAVTFAYPGRQPVLEDLSLRIAAGSTTGIVGVTGAGKTTIAKLLLRFYDVRSGRVLLDGQDIRDLKRRDVRKAIGFVAQDTFLFDGTVAENIRYGSFDAAFERVVDAARVAEADGFIRALPSGYDTMTGERGITLSGGQKQRVSLARAILKSAPIVILDEATSAVDYETEAAIQRALADFARDRTMVIIAHRLSTIRHADWIYVLGEGGAIAEAGTHHQLLDHQGIYASLWRLQSGQASHV